MRKPLRSVSAAADIRLEVSRQRQPLICRFQGMGRIGRLSSAALLNLAAVAGTEAQGE